MSLQLPYMEFVEKLTIADKQHNKMSAKNDLICLREAALPVTTTIQWSRR